MSLYGLNLSSIIPLALLSSSSTCANVAQVSGGTMYNLSSRLNQNKRKTIAAQLLSVPEQRVWCHVTDEDTVLVNRHVRWLVNIM